MIHIQHGQYPPHCRTGLEKCITYYTFCGIFPCKNYHISFFTLCTVDMHKNGRQINSKPVCRAGKYPYVSHNTGRTSINTVSRKIRTTIQPPATFSIFRNMPDDRSRFIPRCADCRAPCLLILQLFPNLFCLFFMFLPFLPYPVDKILTYRFKMCHRLRIFKIFCIFG